MSFWNYIMSFAKEQEINFEEDFSDISSQQLRALFTSYCLMFGVDTSATITKDGKSMYSAECDYLLNEIFWATGLCDYTRKEFNKFMLEFLI